MENQERKNGTIADRIYLYLKKSIMDLKFKPGEEISIKDLAEQLNVSRSPVRDAVMSLEREGLITTIPQKGTMVSRINLERMSEEQFLRLALEEKVLEVFMKTHNQDHLNALEISIYEQKRYFQANDYRNMIEFDDQFHKIFYAGADKGLCWETIQNTSGHYRRARLLTNFDTDISGNIIRQHEQIYESLLNRDGNMLIRLIRQHLSKLEEEKTILLQNYPELFEVPRRQEELGTLQQDFLENLIRDKRRTEV